MLSGLRVKTKTLWRTKKANVSPYWLCLKREGFHSNIHWVSIVTYTGLPWVESAELALGRTESAISFHGLMPFQTNRFHCSESYKPSVLQNSPATKTTGEVWHKFLPPTPKDFFKQRELMRTRCVRGVNHHWMGTTWYTPKDFFKRRELMRTRCVRGVNHHWMGTTWYTTNEFKREHATLFSAVCTQYSSEPVRTMENQWQATDE